MEGPQQERQDVQSLTNQDWLILAVYTLVLLFWQLGAARLFTSHEAMVALGAREMRATSDLLVPRVDGEPWLEKPPLAHWAIVTFAALWGYVDEFSARVPSALFGFAGVMLLAGLVGRTAGRTIGMLTGLTQATTVYFITYARLAEADIYLWGIVVACLVVFAARWVGPQAPERWYNGRLMFFILLGMTGLVKGPLFGAVLTLAACGAFLISQPDRKSALWLAWIPGWLVFLLIAAAWPVAIAIQHPDALILWKQHTIDRIASPNAMNPKPFWYYLTTIPWQLMPWTIVLIPAIPASFRTAWREPRSLDRFMWIWFLAPFVVLSVVKAKHHQYLIHALPPFSYWAALGILRWRTIVIRTWNMLPVRLALMALGTVLVIAAVWWGAPKAKASRAEFAIVGSMILIATTLVGYMAARGRNVAALAILFGALGGLLCYANGVWLPRTDRYPTCRDLLQRIDERNERGSLVLIYKIDPARPLLYLRSPHLLCADKDDLREALQRHPDAYVLVAESLLHEVCNEFGLQVVDRMPPGMRGLPTLFVCSRPELKKV